MAGKLQANHEACMDDRMFDDGIVLHLAVCACVARWIRCKSIPPYRILLIRYSVSRHERSALSSASEKDLLVDIGPNM